MLFHICGFLAVDETQAQKPYMKNQKFLRKYVWGWKRGF
jgi:hypothetical protein